MASETKQDLMLPNNPYAILGKATPRVDGIAKVTGKAKYAAEFSVPNLAYGFIATSRIARGKIKDLHVDLAEKAPGVIKVITHENATKVKGRPGSTFYALNSDRIEFNQQPVALVVAETYEQARYAARLIEVNAEYEADAPKTNVLDILDHPPATTQQGRGDPPRGDPADAFEKSDVKVTSVTTMAMEHHNPMELHGGLGYWQGDKLFVFNKSQGVSGDKRQLAQYFGIGNDDVRVVSLFVGGAFGSALAPHYYTFLLGVASKMVGRPVKLNYTRRQMFTGHGHRPFYWQKIQLGADKTGKLQSILADVAIDSPRNSDFQEGNQRVARVIYACPNVRNRHQPVRLDLPAPSPMRAPGTMSNMTAIEIAMDELAYACKVDPLELRLINYAEVDPDSKKPFSSKALKECYQLGAKTFGWEKRNPEPKSMRDGRLLVGYGMATGTWGAMQLPAAARITLRKDGTAVVASGTSDIGPGSYTVMTMIAAEGLGLPVEKVKFELGDTRLPDSPPQGGSFTTASVGSAVYAGTNDAKKQLLALAKDKFGDLKPDDVELKDGKLQPKGKPADGIAIGDLVAASGKDSLVIESRSMPGGERNQFSTSSHGAQFIEVKVDPDTGMVKVTRVVEASACGRIINPLTCHSQEIGGVVWGIGAALQEQTEIDHRFGRMMNNQLADYHIPVHADVHDINTMFVEEDDKVVNPLGVKGMGELGLVGIPAAICNAVYHATGIRIRDLPITPDKLFSAGLSA